MFNLPCNLAPIDPHIYLYIVKLGFAEIYISYNPALKKWGYTGITLSIHHSVVIQLFCYSVRIWFLLIILRTNRKIETTFCIHIMIDEIYVGIVKHLISQICNRVMILD